MNEILNEKIVTFLRENAVFIDTVPEKQEKSEEKAEEPTEETKD